VLGRLTGGALDLLVPVVADEQDVVLLAGEALRLVVHLRDERAGGVDRAQAAVLRLVAHRGGHAVRGEHHERTLRHLVRLVDEDRATFGQRLHDVHVVDDLLADVDRRAVLLERLLDGLDGPVDTRAVAARRGQQDTLGSNGHAPSVRTRPARASAP
jgi:hypothetical protein